ncbi:hypothetical protein [Salipiger thiooxidans]|uniref:hypothetical protein n=1 Tax=Salipiger thiooxidans TaxID=282683 RepID=UPI000B7E35C7|nr:hypothetical protein [Salipiger thiooxidans]
MIQDYSKLGSSDFSEAFGFGAVTLIAIGFYYRSQLQPFAEVYEFVERIPAWLGAACAAIAVFVSYIAGRSVAALGKLLAEYGGLVSRFDEEIVARVSLSRNESLWHCMAMAERRIGFFHGMLGTAVAMLLLLVFSALAPLLTSAAPLNGWPMHLFSFIILALTVLSCRLASAQEVSRFHQLYVRYSDLEKSDTTHGQT